MMGGFVLGQVSALSPDYEKARVAAARLFRLFDRRTLIDSSSEDGLTPVRVLSTCVLCLTSIPKPRVGYEVVDSL